MPGPVSTPARLTRARPAVPLLALVALLTGLTLLTLATVLGPAAAAATTPDPDAQVSWSVAPAGPDGADGRRVIDTELAPGASTQEHVLVRNLGARTVTFDITANDGYLTASGRFDMWSRDHVPTHAGAWLEAVDTLTLDAGASAVVPVLLQVPADATPGDYSAGVAASVVTATGSVVATEHRVGVRVNVRVAGDLDPALALADLESRYVQSWNPFTPGSVAVSSTVANTGNVRLGSELAASVEPWAGRPRTAVTDTPGLTPGTQAVVVLTTEQVWPLGPLRTTVALRPAVQGAGTEGTTVLPQTVRTLTTWALPAPQVATVLVGLAAALTLRAVVRGRRRRLAVLLDQARQEGIAEAARR